ncbi:MAG: hypothetical protein OEV41_12585, partial [Gammaproteobacteria bacterium]|nr:hypothetical protein [Gammaproteobacteria bacterium]
MSDEGQESINRHGRLPFWTGEFKKALFHAFLNGLEQFRGTVLPQTLLREMRHEITDVDGWITTAAEI